uniref:ClpP family protease n=1 Tax=Clostridium sp. NkU-1 TaxID=1095009 RepID=UPI0032607505
MPLRPEKWGGRCQESVDKEESIKFTVKQEVFKVREYQYRNDQNNEETEERQNNENRPSDNTRKENLDEKKTEKDIEQKEDERLEEYGQMTLDDNAGKRKIHLISIIGEVEGHENLSGNSKATKYDHILPKLAEIEDDDSVEGLLVLLNTSGGDVDAGLAIAEMIASLSIPTVSLVLGGSHSIGVPLAVCTDYSFIVPTGTMMVHP